jgi:PAS domain S-box-containing protein
MLATGAVAASAAFGQSYLVHTYSLDEGLPSAEVLSIAQDPFGRMWFATRAGIVVYDGACWATRPTPMGVSDSPWRFLHLTRDGRMWVAGSDATSPIIAFDSTQWNEPPVVTELPCPSSLLPPEGATVTAFAVSVQNGGPVIVVGLSRHGVLIRRAKRWSRFAPENGLPGDQVRAVLIREDDILVATDKGLCSFAKDRLQRPFDGMERPEDGFYALTEVGSTLWALGSTALYRLERGSDFEIVTSGFELDASNPQAAALVVDESGQCTFGKAGRLLYWTPQAQGLNILDRSNGLISGGVTDLELDREGNLWISSMRGLSKLVSMRFASYRQTHGLVEDEVTAVCEWRNRIVTGHNGGLSFFDGTTWSQRALVDEPQIRGDTARVMDLWVDAQDRLWVAASGRGLAVIDGNFNTHWFHREEEQLVALTNDPQGGLVVGTNTNLYHLLEGRLEPLAYDEQSCGGVRRLITRSSGEVLVATLRCGVLRLEAGKLERIRGPELPGALSVFTVYEDHSGQVWAGTQTGALRLAGSTLRSMIFPGIESTLPVYLIVQDREGRLWFGTNNGVIRWDGHEAKHYTPRHGLAGHETNRDAGYVDSSGRLWIGTETGVSVYNPEHDRTAAQLSPVVVAIESPEGRHPPDRALRLDPGANTLTFHFAAVSFVDESTVVQRCRLIGFDPDWTGPLRAHQRSLRYTNLPPGAYRFVVQASADNGLSWSAPNESAEIQIAEPFRSRWWFLSLCGALTILVAVAAVRAILRWRYANVLEREVSLRRDAEELRGAMFEALQESERRLSLATASGRIGIWDRNLRTGDHYLNDEFKETLGYPSTEITNRTEGWRFLLHPDDVPVVDEELRHHADGVEGTFEVVHRMVTKEGRIRWFLTRGTVIRDADGEPCRMLGTHTDITLTKDLEDELEESRANFASIVENNVDGILIVDKDRVVRFANAAACSYLGQTRFELEGSYFAQELDPGSVSELEIQRGDDETGTAEMRVIDSEWQGAAARLVILRDVTARKQTEAQLLQAQKLEALGRLAGGVAHDFNNLLQALLTTLGFLGAEVAEGTARKKLAELEVQVQRGAALTKQLLLFSRSQRAEPRILELNQVIRDNLGILRRLVREDIRFLLRFDPRPLTVEADRGQLGQVITNLVVNASDAMPNGGDLIIRTGTDGSQKVWFEIEDSGTGIPESIRTKVFEPFFTTKDGDRGTGLGLSVVHGIVTSHGGDIRCSSEEGKGTVFRIILPSSGSVPERDERAAVEEADIQLGAGERILLVEDDSAIREGIADFLTHIGYRVTAVATTGEAEALDRECPFDVLIADLMLEGKRGDALASTLRRRWPALRVIVMSGYSDDEVAESSLEEGTLFLRKPFEITTLSRTIREAIAGTK